MLEALHISGSIYKILSNLFQVLFIETLHSVGLIVMVFLLIPSFDPISGLLFTMSIAVIPSALKIWFPRANQHKEGLHQSNGAKQSFPTRVLVACFSYLAAVGQLAAIGNTLPKIKEYPDSELIKNFALAFYLL